MRHKLDAVFEGAVKDFLEVRLSVSVLMLVGAGWLGPYRGMWLCWLARTWGTGDAAEQMLRLLLRPSLADSEEEVLLLNTFV